MKYSIIIPIYNSEKTLNRCIDSILVQGFEDYEIILVNDGSRDSSFKICCEYRDSNERIKVVDKSGGASSARNAGLDIARGDFVLFVDSDDYVEENFFEEISKHSIKNSLTIFTVMQKKINGTKKREIKDLDNSFSMFEKTKYLISSRTINCVYSKIFDRDIIEKYKIRFNEKIPVAEDFVFCVKYLLLCESVLVFNTSLYVNDQTNSDSLTRSRKKNLIDIYPIVFNEVYNDIIKSKYTEEEKDNLLLIWDKLHVDSFGTCVMEEIKDSSLTKHEKLNEITVICDKFYSEYKGGYGYSDIIHYIMRLCIKYKWSKALYLLGKLYIKLKG